MVVATGRSAPLVTASTDPRITRVGRKLRSTKLDELPQLVNVIRGDMSIVGPRPEVARYVEMWSDDDRRVILSIRPGITDPATLQLRREEQLLAAQVDPEEFYRVQLLPEKTRIYRRYAEEMTFISDLCLILKSIRSIARD
jgi:lipopolysaccharide/colanic/teichoic acid biosynthesis glycosyltransferase